ncbi:hypothetical protein Gotur_023831 [Gossypium turneri]
MLHRGMDWLWVVVEGEENSDYTQIKTANRRVTYLMYIWLSAFAKHGFPFISNRDSILFHSGCAGISIALLDRTVSWHGMFEKRAPALLDNLVQAFLMAPFFVLLEVLQSLFVSEPYPGFHMRVNAKIKTEIKEWQDKKQKKVS